MKKTINYIGSADDNLFAYEQIEFNHWKDLRSYFFAEIDKLIPSSFVYRGHADASWKLQPTIERLRPNEIHPFFKKWYSHVEKKSVESYKYAFHLFADSRALNTEKKNFIDWLSVMQHHGAATRLLDITTSPFVASLFALSDVYNKSKEACIWAFSLEAIDEKNVQILDINTEDKYQDVYNFYRTLKIENEIENPIIGYTFLENPSIRPFNQKGGFLYSMSKGGYFESFLSEYSNDKNVTIKKLVLDITDRQEVISALQDFARMNISYSNLFPGLDGYSKDILVSQYITNS